MQSREELARRVDRLERELAVARGTTFRGVRKRSSWCMGELPLYEIAIGPDPERGEMRGHAKAIIAIGDIATGFVALGGIARGVIALGGLAVGLFGFGGLSIGFLVAFGGLAIGGLAIGGLAIGGAAIGGAAVGQYACGGGALGEHVISATHRDPEAVAFFTKYGLEALCGPAIR